MSSRKVLVGATLVVALLFSAALAGFFHARAQLRGYPERELTVAGLGDQFAAIREGTEALVDAIDHDVVMGARESLGHAVTGFDQDLASVATADGAHETEPAPGAEPPAEPGHEAAAEAHGGSHHEALGDDPPEASHEPAPAGHDDAANVQGADRSAAALAEALADWRDIEPLLADLAAGHQEAHGPAGRAALATLAVVGPRIERALHDARIVVEARGASGRKLLHLSLLAGVALGTTLLLLGGVLTMSTRGQWAGRARPSLPRFKLPRLRKVKRAKPAAAARDAAEPEAKTRGSRVPEHLREPEPAVAPVVRHVEQAAAATPPAPVVPTRPAAPLPMDLDLASATVDKVVVDMAAIAGTTAKMQAAIDAVAAAMQGMLFSLTEMAQDTGEGVRITRTANNAATYTAQTAKELVDSAREMTQIVARVQQLAKQSQEIARQVETDARQTGATGEAFTTVVAGEVRKLVQATATATKQIEGTVNEVLASQRQYEDAVGQVIRNVSDIHRVCAHLGELMLDPPARVQPGTHETHPTVSYAPPPPPPPAPAPAPAPQPASPVAQAPAPAPEVPLAAPPPSPPAATAAPEPATPAPIADVAARVESELSLDLLPPEPAPAPAPAAEPTADPETTAAAAPKPAGSNANVFILNRKPRQAAAPKAEAAPSPAAAAPTVEPTPAAAPAPEAPMPEPPMTEAPIAEELEPVLIGADGAEEEKKEKPTGQGASGNIFILNKKKK